MVDVDDSVADRLEVDVRVDRGPVYGIEETLELVRPMPASIVFVLGKG